MATRGDYTNGAQAAAAAQAAQAANSHDENSNAAGRNANPLHTAEQLRSDESGNRNIDSNNENALPAQQDSQPPEVAPMPLSNGIRSIFRNKFYDKPPIPTWSFSVDFLIPTEVDGHANALAMILANDDQQILSYAVVDATLDKRQMNSVPAYYAGVAMELPSRAVTNGEITMIFNENIEMAVTKVLEKLLKVVFDQEYCNATQHYRTTNGTDYFTIIVKVYRPQDAAIDCEYENTFAPIMVYEYNNCWLSSIGDQKMSYNDEGQVITRSATFKYAYMRVYSGNEYFGLTNEPKTNT